MIQQALKLLALLSDNNVHSGVELGGQLGVSRAAVWKLVQKMQQQYGVDITSVNGLGYCLANPLPLLDAEQIRRFMTAPGEQLGCSEITVLDSVDSTNEVALRNATKGSPNLSVWLAEHQTSGRGRRGKSWYSPMLGNIYCSLLWRVTGGAPALEGLSLVVGIALAEGLSVLGLRNIQLKWPNDLWVNDKKLGGILIEVAGDPYEECATVIGFGINIRMSPQMTSIVDQAVTSLDQYIEIDDRNRIVAVLLSTMCAALDEHKRFGFSRFSERWRAFDAMLGRSVNAVAGESVTTGMCVGVSSRGALLLETRDGLLEVYSGEVSVRPN